MPKPYFTDDLFHFQTYLSGRYEVGYHELQWRTNVQDMAPVWDDYRGGGVSVGVLGTVDRLHPDLKKNYDTRYLGHHDPLDDLAGDSSGYGTFAAGVVAADDNGRGLVGMAPDAKVFSWTLDPREKPDITITLGQDVSYGRFTDAGDLFDKDGRGGLGTIAVAGSPEIHWTDFEPESTSLGDGEMLQGMTNSEFGLHSDRGVITTVGASVDGIPALPVPSGGFVPGLSVPKGPVLGDMLLVTAPVGTSSFMETIFDLPLDDPAFDAPSNVGNNTIWETRDAAATTLGLDHRGGAGSQGAGALGGIWSRIVEAKFGDQVGSIETGDYAVDTRGRAASAVVGGAVALMLDANPDLGWRDVQAILAHSADPIRVAQIPFLDPTDWTAFWDNTPQTWNGGGLIYSGAYGFGGLDTRAAVRLAETWGEGDEGARTSRNERIVTAEPVAGSDLTIGPLNRSFEDMGDNGASIRFRLPKEVEIEHVALDIAFDVTGATSMFTYGDNVAMHLVSPNEVRSHLAANLRDAYSDGVSEQFFAGSSVDRAFTSRAFWGQQGEAGDVWTLRIEGKAFDDLTLDISDLALKFYGAPADDDDTYVYTDSLITMKKTGASLGLKGSIADTTGHGGTIRDGEGTDTLNASAITEDARLSAAPGGEGRAGGESLYRLSDGTDMDRIYAGDGDDRLTGWRESERLHGGRGDDSIEGEGGSDRLKGEDGRDKLYGGSGSDQIWGGDGKDRLRGQDGDDKLWGNDGSDRLYGGDGKDRLRGGSGSDRLEGGSGADVLSGQGGADVFVLARGGGRDVVRDFTIGVDRVDASEVAGGFQGVRILDRGPDALIQAGGAALWLEDTDGARLHAHDFLF